jgi:hypothetical protein
MTDWEDRLIIVARGLAEAHQDLDGSYIVGGGRIGHYASGRVLGVSHVRIVCVYVVRVNMIECKKVVESRLLIKRSFRVMDLLLGGREVEVGDLRRNYVILRQHPMGYHLLT